MENVLSVLILKKNTNMPHLSLEELDVYNLSMSFGEKIYRIVSQWDYFHKNSLGKQLISSADSIAANIAEGYGRFYYKENKLFCYYARGSLTETKSWLKKANTRKLISDEDYNLLVKEAETLHLKLNAYIKSLGK